MALSGLVSCPNLDQMDWERKREGKERKKRKREGKERKKRKREGKCGIFRERSSTFSLSFPAIGPLASNEERSKVASHGKDYMWVPVLGSLDKLQKKKVGVFLLLALLFA